MIPAQRRLASLSFLLATFAVGACDSTSTNEGRSPSRFPEVQEIVDGLSAANRADVVRLSVHAIPSGEEQSIFVASTASDRIGKPSDPEDVAAIESGTATVLREGANFDVTLPLRDALGNIQAAAGVTLSLPAEATEAEARNRAETLADELERLLIEAGGPLW